MPLVRVRVLVDPVSNASASCQVPPTPLKVMSEARVMPFEVMVLVPEVAVKVIAPV